MDGSAVLELGISLLLTIFVYLFFPLTYIIGEGKVSKKKGTKYALINSIVCAIIFCVARAIISGGRTIVSSLAPAVLYYFIAKLILIDPSLPDDNDATSPKHNKCCQKCGTLLNGDRICPNCGADNTKLTNLTQSVSVIKKLQLSTIIISICLAVFAIVYPIAINASAKNRIPQYSEANTSTYLTNLDENKVVYCEIVDDYNYLYMNENNEIKLYRFFNRTMYNSSGNVISGRATSKELKTYFKNNIYSGKPTATYIMPAVLPIGLSIGAVAIIVMIIMIITIHKIAKEQIFQLKRSDPEFKKLFNDYKKEEISKENYNKSTKDLFSRKIVKNNKFFSVFKIFY